MNIAGASGREKTLTATILDTIHDAVVWIDHNSKIVEWNLAAERLFGFHREDVIGRSLTSTIIPDEHRVAHLDGMSKYMQTGEGQLFGHSVEIDAMTWAGSKITVAITIGSILVDGESLFTAQLRALDEDRCVKLKTESINSFPPPSAQKAG